MEQKRIGTVTSGSGAVAGSPAKEKIWCCADKLGNSHDKRGSAMETQRN